MAPRNRQTPLSPPFMHAFRAAFTEKDARKKLDLRDEGGDRVIAPRRAATRTAVSEPVLRREVARDLENLLNAISFGSSEDLANFGAVEKSILNYGLPDFIHRTIDEAENEKICGEITTALHQYEPRLVAGSIIVERDASLDKSELKIRFLVRADLMCKPVNVPIEFIADVELFDGGVTIRKL